MIKASPQMSEKGAIFIEILVGLVVLGLVGVAILSGFTTSFKAITIIDENALAKNLARNQMEYIDKQTYQYEATTYPQDPGLEIPDGWEVLPSIVEPLHGVDDGIQKVTVTVQNRGKEVYTLAVYKLDL
jgi:hypothetical protein